MNDFLAKIAPTLASALLGPFAGVAVAGITKILGIDGGTVADVTKAISEGKITPEQLAEIQKLELKYKDDEAERGFKYADLEFKDRDSARKREIETGDKVTRNLAYLIVVAFVAVIGFTLAGLSQVESVLAGTLIGYLSAKAEQVMSYYFGSSKGSDKKTDLLAAGK